jgi:hypothetical protein
LKGEKAMKGFLVSVTVAIVVVAGYAELLGVLTSMISK